MNKPTAYDTTQAAGEFEPIKLGGHKMVIKQISEKKTQGGLDMLVILFDFAEGDEQAGYFMKQFENDIRPDKKYPNAGTNYMVIDEGVDYGVRNLKTFITCVEKSNPGFAVKWGDNFGQQFKGKLIGGIFRLEKDWYDNKEVKRHKLARFRSVEGIKDADIPEERTTKAYDDHLKEEAIMGANPAGTDFMNIPDSVADDVLPFN
uniref:Uncharacterized protein n=1 Tax=Siphoviridae sp. ctqK313 TaxID=2827946 RepID=A0A8S5TC17_9CAUD|nr:MAG TPA: Protein of unknown function (DUF669) [Siphoviridae sp. ctqK313]